jgi:nucleoside permease NupC
MNIKKYQPILEITTISTLVYGIHKLFFLFNEANIKYQNFYFQIEFIYGFFFICSLITLLILIKVKKKNIDNIGYVFTMLTGIKTVISYAVLYPILNSGNLNLRVEKINFFVIFALFLTVETVVTIRILNNKQ